LPRRAAFYLPVLALGGAAVYPSDARGGLLGELTRRFSTGVAYLAAPTGILPPLGDVFFGPPSDHDETRWDLI